MANFYRANKKSGITPTGTKNITANGIYDVTNYESANVNVPTGVELPSQLEIKTVHNSDMFVFQGSATQVRGALTDSFVIPKFLCDNYKYFIFTANNTGVYWDFKANGESITPLTRYTIADHVTTAGMLAISINYSTITQGSGVGIGNTYTITLIND